MGVCWDETKKLSSCDHIVDVDAATATEVNEDGNNSEKLRPRSENSEDPQDSIGPFGQAADPIPQQPKVLSLEEGCLLCSAENQYAVSTACPWWVAVRPRTVEAFLAM
ncbi:hypothetical protein Goari_015438 [Gossypium aridum]|uniref:Uncharacterized protein n=1 Tax=Gossypium aridum TaxID=34290 RepID=A0A7J8WFX3_GOSAI|nr:hypothetical protein [Gossypium aridum]